MNFMAMINGEIKSVAIRRPMVRDYYGIQNIASMEGQALVISRCSNLTIAEIGTMSTEEYIFLTSKFNEMLGAKQ